MKKLVTTTIAAALVVVASLTVGASSASAASFVSGPWKQQSHCVANRNIALTEPGIIVTSGCYASGSNWYFTYMRN